MINIGKYIEIAINWLTEHFARFFDVINAVSYTHLTLPTIA